MYSILLVVGIGVVLALVFSGGGKGTNQSNNRNQSNNPHNQQAFNRQQQSLQQAPRETINQLPQNNFQTQQPYHQGQPQQGQSNYPNAPYQQPVTINSGRTGQQLDDKTDEYYEPFHGQVLSNHTRVYVASTIGRSGFEEIFRSVRLRLEGKRQGIRDHSMRDKDITNYTYAVRGKSADMIISLAEKDKDEDGFDFMQFLFNTIIQNYPQYEIDKITGQHGGISDIVLRDVRYHGQSMMPSQSY